MGLGDPARVRIDAIRLRRLPRHFLQRPRHDRAAGKGSGSEIDRPAARTEQPLQLLGRSPLPPAGIRIARSRAYGGSFRAPIVPASRAIFVGHPTSGSITRFGGQIVERVPYRTSRLHYQTMRSDWMLVVVATPPDGTLIEETELEIEVAGEEVTAEPPDGWSVTRAGECFKFLRTDDVKREILALAFRNAGDGAIRVHETERRTLELG